MLYAVIAATEAAVATEIALVRDAFETRLMAESFSTRPRGLSLIFTIEVQRVRLAREMYGVKREAAETFQRCVGRPHPKASFRAAPSDPPYPALDLEGLWQTRPLSIDACGCQR